MGARVEYEHDTDLCRHEWHREHHYGDAPDGGLFHYCPTGFDYCAHCAAIRETPEGEEECTKWGTA